MAIVAYKDRLTRFGFELIEELIQKYSKGDVEYLLSLECFEKICLTSETHKGDAFREFFINLRKFIDYYKTHFTNTINKMVQPKKYIYVISVDKNKNIQRFGKTLNIQKKLNNIAQNKENIQILIL